MSTEKSYVDVLTERSAGAMAIAEADEGWENVPIDCPMLQAVRDLRCHADALERAQMAAKLTSGSAAIVRMRDEFLQLVAAFNAGGDYKSAQDAQGIAILLDEFEGRHTLREILWPPRVCLVEGVYEFVEVD